MRFAKKTNTAQRADSKSSTVIYRERLLPGPLTWLLVAFMTGSLGIAYGYVYGNSFGIALAIVSTLGIYVLMYIASPVVHIDTEVVRVGNARLPLEFVGDVQKLDKAQTLNSRRAPAPRNAYLVLRASVPESILLTVSDVSDPHPYWHFSTRNTQKFIAALELQKHG